MIHCPICEMEFKEDDHHTAYLLERRSDAWLEPRHLCRHCTADYRAAGYTEKKIGNRVYLALPEYASELLALVKATEPTAT